MSVFESTFTSLTPFNPPSAFWRGQGPQDQAHFREEGMWALSREINNSLQVCQLDLGLKQPPFPLRSTRRERRREETEGGEMSIYRRELGDSKCRELGISSAWRRQSLWRWQIRVLWPTCYLIFNHIGPQFLFFFLAILRGMWDVSSPTTGSPGKSLFLFCKMEVVMSISQGCYKNKWDKGS